MSTTGRPLGDDVLVRRAARGVAAQTAGLVALAILLLVSLTTIVVVRGQTQATDALLRSTVLTANDVVDPPPDGWLVLVRDGRLTSSPGLPTAIGSALEGLRNSASAVPTLADVSRDDHRDYRVASERRDAITVQVVLDLSSDHQQRRRLLTAMGIASALGLIFATALGVVIGRRAVRPLGAALALQRSFIADASHELRTPLTLLSTRAQVLDRSLQNKGLAGQVLVDAHGVVTDVARLAEVVEDLLLAADPLGEEPQRPTDLAHVLAAVVDSATAHAADARVTLLGPTEEGPAAAWVMASAPALRRAVLTLVDNAIDHTPAGGAVTVGIRRRRADIVLSVSDTGPGVSPEAAQHLFQRFHSGGQRSGRAHYGLGLALTHDVANRHGGQVRLVASDVGATFELILPALPGQA